MSSLITKAEKNILFRKEYYYSLRAKKRMYEKKQIIHLEITHKEEDGISPIFENQKQKKILGIYRFLILKKITKKKVIGLGGINKLTIKKLRAMKCDGFASISLIKTLYNETRR